MEDNREHYKILEIDETATKEDIRKAFKKQALRWHPDKHPPENKVVAEEIFKKVAMAYEVLSGNAKTQFFKEDVFSSFFAKFFQKYQKWGDDWTSPENKEARKKATAALWEEEDLKYTDQKNIRIRNLKIKYPEDIETWPEYAATKNMPIHSITSFEHNEVLNSKICFWNGHIYSLAVDAICNSTDSSLSGSGCLDSTLHCFAGMKLREECLLMDECPIGQAVITRAYELPAKYIIHCIGPNNRDPHALASCYYSALDLAVEHKIRTIAFPCVATGLNCFPIHASAQIVLQTTRRWLEKDNNWNKIDKIIFVFWRTVEEICYSTWAPTVFPLPSTLTYSEAILQDEVKTIHYWAKNSSFLDKWVYGEENNQNSVIPPEPHSLRDSAIHFLDEEDDPPKDIDNFDFGYLSDLSSDEEDGRVSDDSSIKEKEGGVRDDMSIKEKDGGVSDDRSIKEKEGGVSDDRSIKEKGGVSDDMSIKEKGGVCDDSSIKEKEGGVSDDMSIKEKGGVCDDRSIKEKDGSGVCTKEKCDDDGDDDRDEKDGSGIGDKMFNRIYRKFM